MANLQEHVIHPYDDHHMIATSEGCIPMKVLHHQGIYKLILKVETGRPFKSLRVSRYRSYTEVPKDALYIDSIIIDGTMYHYFELENG